MTSSTIRPKVAQLTFQFFNRALHPELFQVLKSHRVERDCYTATLHITTDGHVVQIVTGDVTLTEVAASVHQPLPQNRRLLLNPLSERRSESIQCRNGISFHYEHELERVKPELFWLIQQQLGESAKNHELIQVFDASGRMAIGGMSFVHVETRSKCLRLQAIHTFPDDLALVKIQSTYAFT
jgi:Protein of unknown function DUF2617